ncbi:MAG TPA: UMP kinase [Firmicutes bacterium]|nr:UMP kinase [Bacillota bacterium]
MTQIKPDKHEFNRIMLKLSGEALGGKGGTGLDHPTIKRVTGEIADVVKSGKRIAIVMGAGNYVRGRDVIAYGMDNVTAHQMGMIATIINALALRDVLNRSGIEAVAMSAIPVGSVIEPFSAQTGRKYLDEGIVVLCAGGTGNPFFTTDTAAILRAIELQCDVMFKATMVDGVYDKDPALHPDAKRFDSLTYDEVIERKLKVMDLTAVTLAAEKKIPIVVIDLWTPGTMKKVSSGEINHGTLISD